MRAYAKVSNGLVVEKIITNDSMAEPGWIEMPLDLGYSPNPLKYDGTKFVEDKPKSTEEIVAELQQSNVQLKQQLEITQAALDKLLLGGTV